MSITYSIVDKFGTTHTRHSAGHTAPIYAFASINYGPEGDWKPRKALINYSRTRQGALKNACADFWDQATRTYRPNRIDVVEVTATAGRLKT